MAIACQLAYLDVVARFDYDGRPVSSATNVENTINGTKGSGFMVGKEESKMAQKKTLWALPPSMHQAYIYARRRSLPELSSGLHYDDSARTLAHDERQRAHSLPSTSDIFSFGHRQRTTQYALGSLRNNFDLGGLYTQRSSFSGGTEYRVPLLTVDSERFWHGETVLPSRGLPEKEDSPQECDPPVVVPEDRDGGPSDSDGHGQNGSGSQQMKPNSRLRPLAAFPVDAAMNMSSGADDNDEPLYRCR